MAAHIDLTALPTAEHITLLLKRHKSTVVLSVLPEESFTNIKGLLLAALQSRKLTTLPGSEIPVPENPDDFEFGVLKDKKDPSKGWISLSMKLSEAADPKSAKRKSTGKQVATTDTPAGTGLNDGSMIAFRVKAEYDQQGDDNDQMTDIMDDPGWDVILPIYEDEADDDT